MTDITCGNLATGIHRSVGIGECIGHHGEFLQGVFSDGGGRLVRGLLTVPCAALKSRVTFWPAAGDTVSVRPQTRKKAECAARSTLAFLNQAELGGTVTIESDIPQGAGYGSSTADVIATIRAVADAWGVRLPRLTESKIAIAAEMASDAVAFAEQPTLFAHRAGDLIEIFAGDFPELSIVGFNTGDPVVETSSFPPARYSSIEIEQFRVLRAITAHSIRAGDGKLLSRVASESAIINQRHHPLTRFREIQEIAKLTAAWGVQIAHSGNIAGLIFSSSDPKSIDRAIDLLKQESFDSVACFGMLVGQGAH